MKKVVDKGFPLIEKMIEMKERIEKPKFTFGMIGFLVIIACIINSTGILVFYEKMDDGNFTFLMGTLFGASITIFNEILTTNQK